MKVSAAEQLVRIVVDSAQLEGWEEMMIGWFYVAVDAGKDPADVFREKKKGQDRAGL
jgi:hypothetical protein